MWQIKYEDAVDMIRIECCKSWELSSKLHVLNLARCKLISIKKVN